MLSKTNKSNLVHYSVHFAVCELERVSFLRRPWRQRETLAARLHMKRKQKTRQEGAHAVMFSWAKDGSDQNKSEGLEAGYCSVWFTCSPGCLSYFYVSAALKWNNKHQEATVFVPGFILLFDLTWSHPCNIIPPVSLSKLVSSPPNWELN